MPATDCPLSVSAAARSVLRDSSSSIWALLYATSALLSVPASCKLRARGPRAGYTDFAWIGAKIAVFRPHPKSWLRRITVERRISTQRYPDTLSTGTTRHPSPQLRSRGQIRQDTSPK